MNTTGAAVSFPDWKVRLRAVTSGDEQRAYFEAIVGFLRHCKEQRRGASVGVAKAYVEAQSAKGDEVTRFALRWFFRAALSRAKQGAAESVPTPGEHASAVAAQPAKRLEREVGAGGPAAFSGRKEIVPRAAEWVVRIGSGI